MTWWDFRKSDGFYGALLPRLGWTRGDAGVGWRTWDPPRGGSYLTLVQSEAPHVAVGYHRKRVGLNHLAFAVETQLTRSIPLKLRTIAGSAVARSGKRHSKAMVRS